MTSYNSPALARFNRLLAEQRQFAAFLEAGLTSLDHSIETFEMTYPYLTTAELDANLPELPHGLKPSEITQDVHFEVAIAGDLYHWESIGPFEEAGICSDDGFERQAECAREAKETLSLVSKFGVEAALERIDHRDLLISRLYPSDLQAIVDALSVLPFDEQWEAGYQMALNMRPMPAQYWPEQP